MTNLHLFNFDSDPPSVERINPLLTINGQTVSPMFVYNGKDANSQTWPPWGYGEILNRMAEYPFGRRLSEYIVFDTGSPFFGKRDGSVTMIGGITYQKVPYGEHNPLYNVTTEDMVIRVIYKANNGSNFPPLFANWPQREATYNGYVLRAGKYFSFFIKNIDNEECGCGTPEIPTGWVDAMIFVDRSGGAQIYINGSRSGSAGTSTTKSITSEGPFSLGLADGNDMFHGTVAYVAMWKQDSWLDSHLQDSLAAKLFQELTGVYPKVYSGTPDVTYSRNSTALLEKYESGTKRFYRVGKHWPRTCSIKDYNNDIITGYFSEVESTNLLLQSETLGTTWTQVALTSISNNDAYGPEGPVFGYPMVGTLDGLVGNASDTQHGVRQSVTLTLETYCLSCWVAPGNKSWCYLFNSTISDGYAYFDLSGEVGSVGSGVIDCNIYRCSADLYRIWITFTGTAASHTVGLYAANADGDNDFAGDTATVNIHAGCFQCEIGTYPSSYIPTTTAIVTRVEDSLEYNGDNVSEGQGQLLSTIYPFGSGSGYLCELSGSGNISVSRDNEQIAADSEDYHLTNITSVTDGYIHRVQHFWNTNGATLAVDFEFSTPDTLCDIPSITNISIGNGFNGLIKDFRILPTYNISQNTSTTKDWEINYPENIDSTLQMFSVQASTDRLRVHQLHAIRDSIIALEREVGSYYNETNSIRSNVCELENNRLLYFASVQELIDYPISDLKHKTVVLVDGYYSVMDGGEDTKYLDLSMTLGGNAANGGTIIYANDGKDYSDSTKAYWRSTNWDGDVKVFGVLGGEEHDDSRKFKAAVLEACRLGIEAVVDNITVYVRDHILLYGKGCLVGKHDAIIMLDGISLTEEEIETGGRFAYFGLGIREIGEDATGDISDSAAEQHPSIWSGYIRNLIFKTTNRNNIQTLFSLAQTRACRIEHVKLYAQNSSGESIAFSSDASMSFWLNFGEVFEHVPYGSKDTIIQNCFMDSWLSQRRDLGGAQNFGIDFGGVAIHHENINILNNTLIGTSDDIIALHGCKNFRIIGNVCKPIQGRILINSSRDGVVAENYLEKLTTYPSGATNAGSWCYYVGLESCLAGKPGRILMVNNIARIPEHDVTTSAHCAFRLSALFDSIFANNIIINDQPGISEERWLVEIAIVNDVYCGEGGEIGGWDPGTEVDDLEYPYTYYPDTVPGYDGYLYPRIYNLQIYNNMCVGKYGGHIIFNLHGVPAYDSKITIDNNYFTGYGLGMIQSPLVYGVKFGRNYFNDTNSNVSAAQAFNNVNYLARSDQDSLCIFSHQFLASGNDQFELLASDTRIEKFMFQRTWLLMAIKVQTDQVLIGSDTLTFTIEKEQGGGPGPAFSRKLNESHQIMDSSDGTTFVLSFQKCGITDDGYDYAYKDWEFIKIKAELDATNIGLYSDSQLSLFVSLEGVYI